jgi:hypothetical protein
MPGVKILCVHGVGHAEQDPHWNQPWRDAIANAFTRWNNFSAPEFSVVAYDDLFANAPLNPFEYVAAVGELLASAAWHAIAGRRERKHSVHPILEIMPVAGLPAW